MTTRNEHLEKVLQSIVIENTENFILNDFIDDISEKMPGWTIEVWDCDEYNIPGADNLTRSVLAHVLCECDEGRTEVQYGEWCTDICDAYFFVVATKKPGSK